MTTCAICYEQELSLVNCDKCLVSVCYDCFVEWTQTLIQGCFIQNNDEGRNSLERMTFKCTAKDCIRVQSVDTL